MKETVNEETNVSKSEDIISEFRGEYRFLSNFYGCPVTYGGLTYHSAEAAFQAQKCFSEAEKVKYTAVTNPVVAKRMGKKEPGFPANWDEICFDIMKGIVEAKFQNTDLRELLLSTGDRYIEEGNRHHDNRWGHCICEKCRQKEGFNWLGKILMEVRKQLTEN